MTTLLYILIATSVVSLGALVGIFTLGFNEKFLNKILMGLVALSSGTMLGGAFIHLLPEGVENGNVDNFFLIVLFTLVFYLLIEKLLHWRHCHKHGGSCHTHHSIGTMNLIGDSVHNFIDGLIIAGAFLVSVPLGIATTFAMALHEIPQEIGDFGVLIYSGFTKKKALMLNFLVALMVVLGGVVGWGLSHYIDNVSIFLIPIAVGGFIYISTSDLLPEIRKDVSIKKFLLYLLLLLLGIGLMFLVKLIGE